MAQGDHEGRRVVGGLGQFEDGRGDLALQSQSFLNSVTELLVRDSLCVGNRSVVEVHLAACVLRPPFSIAPRGIEALGVVKVHREDRAHPDALAQQVRLGLIMVVVDILQPLPRNRVE